MDNFSLERPGKILLAPSYFSAKILSNDGIILVFILYLSPPRRFFAEWLNRLISDQDTRLLF